ncbi:MAG: hypothetical protein ISS56_06690 [Anaerolineae bacterium]|nr:hypothetical protein [Anaerolineae bacterium]
MLGLSSSMGRISGGRDDNVDKRASILVGTALILWGAFSMAVTFVLPMFGVSVWGVFAIWRWWPLLVVCAGLCFVLPPFLYRDRRGLGGLLIPGMPVLTTGGILLFASVLDWWGAWRWLWPLEVLSLATGFVLAAVHMRAIWLLIPAAVLGLNGAVLQFCAVTGLWNAWAVLWTVEPLAVGLALLVIGARKRRNGLLLPGFILCGLAGLGVVGMTAITSGKMILRWMWLVKLLGPGTLIFVGVLLLGWSLLRHTSAAQAARE